MLTAIANGIVRNKINIILLPPFHADFSLNLPFRQFILSQSPVLTCCAGLSEGILIRKNIQIQTLKSVQRPQIQKSIWTSRLKRLANGHKCKPKAVMAAKLKELKIIK
jgi:hypothetical protein